MLNVWDLCVLMEATTDATEITQIGCVNAGMDIAVIPKSRIT